MFVCQLCHVFSPDFVFEQTRSSTQQEKAGACSRPTFTILCFLEARPKDDEDDPEESGDISAARLVSIVLGVVSYLFLFQFLLDFVGITHAAFDIGFRLLLR